MRVYGVTVSGAIMHDCGERVEWTLQPRGDEQLLRFSEQNRLTFEASFAKPDLHFKAHGTRVKKCPKCGTMLPTTIE